MKLTLHPDPGTGHHWRLTLEVEGIELSCDVARRGVLDQSVIVTASCIAEALGLVASGAHEWRPAASAVRAEPCDGECRLAPGNLVAVRAYAGAPFRAGFTRLRPDGELDLTEIVGATETDLLYRVEPEVPR